MFENREIWDYRDAAYDPVTGQAVRSLQIFFVSRRADSVSFSYWLSWVYSSVMSAASQLHRTEEFLHQQIPITSAMGVRVAAYDGGQLILTAPIALNHNHLGTAFGGSLGAVATLAGYGLLWLELRDRGCHIVIRQSSLSFRRPVRKEIVAICRRPSTELLREFKEAFGEHGKARIGLDVTIEEDSLVAVEFHGIFVALK